MMENMLWVNINEIDAFECQKKLDLLRKGLSVRANNVLRANGLIDILAFVDYVNKSNALFQELSGCGFKTASELSSMTNELMAQVLSISKSEKHESPDLFDLRISDIALSPRTRNVLDREKIIKIRDLVSLNRDKVLGFRNLGRKSLKELDELLASMNLRFGMDPASFLQEKNYCGQPELSFCSRSDWAYVFFFQERCNHLPMIYLLCKAIVSCLSKRELDIIKMYYGIGYERQCSLDEIALSMNFSRERIRQKIHEVTTRLKKDPEIIEFVKHEDWHYYGVSRLPLFVYELEPDVRQVIMLESEILDSFMQINNIDITNKTIINEYTFKHLLYLWGMMPYWVMPKRCELKKNHCQKNEVEQQYLILINEVFENFMIDKVFKEIQRLMTIKSDVDVRIPLKKYFVENEKYWKSAVRLSKKEESNLEDILIEIIKLMQIDCVDGCILIKACKLNLSEKLYEILKERGDRMHRDELLQQIRIVCQKEGFPYKYEHSSQIVPYLTKDPRIVPIGKSSYWGLKEWGQINDGISRIAIRLVEKSLTPILISDLAKEVFKNRPDSNEKSIMSIIRQKIISGELLLFYGDYIGSPKLCYTDKFILMPKSFEGWLDAFRNFVIKNGRFPYAGKNGYEGYLYRWHFRASQLINLSPEEVLKIDAFEKELALFPQNAIEYKFYQNCILYKRFVEGNNRMVVQMDDLRLYTWFNKSSNSYSFFDDNRKIYFSQLLQDLASLLY